MSICMLGGNAEYEPRVGCMTGLLAVVFRASTARAFVSDAMRTIEGIPATQAGVLIALSRKRGGTNADISSAATDPDGG